MANRFDFEQLLLECWNITQDINTINEYVIEGDNKAPEYTDRISNMLIGVSELHELKFNKLFDMFSDLVKNNEL